MALQCFGGFCQGSMSSKYAGFQCTMIVLYALAFAFLTPCNEWNTMTMNTVLHNGDRMYTSYIDNYMSGMPQFLAHDQLHIVHNVELLGHVLQPTVHSNLFYGAVGINPDVDSLAAILNNAFETAFQLSSYVLITLDELTIAVVSQNGQFFLFDSHARNQIGQVSEYGTSILLTFESLNDITEYITGVYNNYMFNISPVQFSLQSASAGHTSNMELYHTENDHCNGIQQNDDTMSYTASNLSCQMSDDANTNECKDGPEEMSVDRCQANNNTNNNGGNRPGMLIEPEYILQQPKAITVECENVRRMLDAFANHSYHYRHANLTSFFNDHDYCQNKLVNNDLCGQHYLPYERYIQEKLDYYCFVCHRLLFKNNCKNRIVDGIKHSFCSTCNIKTKNGLMPSIAWRNNMDPGPIPTEIKELKNIERRFISLIHVFYDSILIATTSTDGYKRYCYQYSSISI